MNEKTIPHGPACYFVQGSGSTYDPCAACEAHTKALYAAVKASANPPREPGDGPGARRDGLNVLRDAVWDTLGTFKQPPVSLHTAEEFRTAVPRYAVFVAALRKQHPDLVADLDDNFLAGEYEEMLSTMWFCEPVCRCLECQPGDAVAITAAVGAP